MHKNSDLIQHLIANNRLQSPEIIAVFHAIDRKNLLTHIWKPVPIQIMH